MNLQTCRYMCALLHSLSVGRICSDSCEQFMQHNNQAREYANSNHNQGSKGTYSDRVDCDVQGSLGSTARNLQGAISGLPVLSRSSSVEQFTSVSITQASDCSKEDFSNPILNVDSLKNQILQAQKVLFSGLISIAQLQAAQNFSTQESSILSAVYTESDQTASSSSRNCDSVSTPTSAQYSCQTLNDTPLTRYSISRAAERVAPAVVNIRVEIAIPIAGNQKRSIGQSVGTGFIFSKDGAVITNYHVIRDALDQKVVTKLVVQLSDNRVYNASVVVVDQESDLAVIRLEHQPGEASSKSQPQFQAAPLGKSAPLRVGEWIAAVGCPLSLSNTVSCGIVSALHRQGGADLGLESTPHKTTSFLQTDCAINMGNSGGPIIDIDGNVVGVATMKAYSADGISFAVPIDDVKYRVHDLITYGHVRKPYIGTSGLSDVWVDVVPMGIKGAQRLQGVSSGKGVKIQKVDPASPASRAGLRPNDVIIGFHNHERFDPQISQAQLREVLRQNIDKPIKLSVYRQGEGVIDVNVITEELKT